MAVTRLDPPYQKIHTQISWLYLLWKRSCGRSKSKLLWIFDFFWWCDLDPDPMTFIHHLDPYSLDIHRMCKIPTSYVKAFDSYHLADKQTDRTRCICRFARGAVKKWVSKYDDFWTALFTKRRGPQTGAYSATVWTNRQRHIVVVWSVTSSTGVVQPLRNTDHRRLYERRTAHVAVSVERSRRLMMSAMSWQSSARHAGALPDRHWKTRTGRTAIWNWTRCLTGNQCRCHTIGVMWSRRRAPVKLTSRAAAFWPIVRDAAALQTRRIV